MLSFFGLKSVIAFDNPKLAICTVLKWMDGIQSFWKNVEHNIVTVPQTFLVQLERLFEALHTCDLLFLALMNFTLKSFRLIS